MKIVIEYVLLENLLINLIVLKTVSLILKEKGRLFLLSSILGAAFCVALPAIRLNTLGFVLFEFGQSLLAICISFKFRTIKKFAQLFITYLIATFLYGGICSFIANLVDEKSFIAILGSIAVCFVLVNILTRKIYRKRDVENFCFDAQVCMCGKSGKFRAFLDTGNLLFDPISNQPVSLINYHVFQALFPEIEVRDIICKSEKMLQLPEGHYITLTTVSGGDKIFVFKADKIFLNNQQLENPMLALCLKNFQSAFESDIILHNNFSNCCK